MIYDIIGDIHGQADKLIGLLTKLGYRHNGISFIAPQNHQAIFVGDFIDRGNQGLATLKIVFDMIDNGQAQAIMGNHEFNAIAYATKGDDGEYLRPHTPQNRHQHKAFLDEVVFHSKLHQEWLQRLYQLPLFLEFDTFIVVHACFDKLAIEHITPFLKDNKLSCDTFCLLHQTPQHLSALENILKGVEATLAKPFYIIDSMGNKRENVRIAWWHDSFKSPNTIRPLHTVSAASFCDMSHIPDDFIYQGEFHLKTNKPIFIGHYWCTGTPKPLSTQVVCTDYSAGKDGYLTAYRFDSQNPILSQHCFVQFIH